MVRWPFLVAVLALALSSSAAAEGIPSFVLIRLCDLPLLLRNFTYSQASVTDRHEGSLGIFAMLVAKPAFV